MMTVAFCGAEGPLGVNLQLSRFDESSSKVELWDKPIEGVSRYSFVSVPSGRISDAVSWTDRLFDRHTIKGQVFVGWQFQETGPLRIRSRAIESALKGAGWDITIADDLALASHDLDSPIEKLEVPASCTKSLQGFFILLRNNLSLAQLCASPFETSIRHFSIAQRMQPSVEFIRAICARGSSLIYTSTASDTRHGIVFVGPSCEAPDVANLQRAGFIQDIYWNEQASRVWSI